MRRRTVVYRVPSETKVPTVQVGDRVTLNQGAYDDAAPEIGDIVIHHPPVSAEEGIECGGTQPRVGQMCARASGERADEPYIADNGGGEGCDFPRPITIPEGHYFMLGDNRGASDDSRLTPASPTDDSRGARQS
jgi:signal peptidase I